MVTANGKSLITAANYAAMRGLLDLEVGTDFNAYITALSGITNGIRVTGASAQYAEITHDGTDTIINSSVGSINLQKTGGTGAAILALSDGSSNYINLTAPSIAADYTLTLPTAVPGNNNMPLVGSTAGALSFGTDLYTAMTIGGAYITRVGGTDSVVADGGTGVSTFALNGILFGNAANAIGVTAIGAEGQILRVGASPFVPAWTTAAFPATAGSAGNALISNGTNWTSANVLSAVPTGLTYTTATRAVSLTSGYMIPGGGSAGQILTSAGASAPAFTTATYPATASTAGKGLVADGTNWVAADILSAVPTGLTYTTATRALSLTANYFIPDTASGWTFDHLHITKGVYYTETDDGDSGTTKTIDFTVTNAHHVHLTGNCTFTFTAPPSACSLILRCVADGTSRTITWPSTVKWAAATKPTHTATNGSVDLIAFYFDGTYYNAGATLDIR